MRQADGFPDEHEVGWHGWAIESILRQTYPGELGWEVLSDSNNIV